MYIFIYFYCFFFVGGAQRHRLTAEAVAMGRKSERLIDNKCTRNAQITDKNTTDDVHDDEKIEIELASS